MPLGLWLLAINKLLDDLGMIRAWVKIAQCALGVRKTDFMRLCQNSDLMGLNRSRISTQRHQKHKVNSQTPDQKQKFFVCGCIILVK